LADRNRDRFAGVPPLLALLTLPLGGRHEPLHLVRQVDPALDAEAEGRRPFVDLVDAGRVSRAGETLVQHETDGVEVHIARLLDGVPEIERAMTLFLVARERAAIERAVSGTVDAKGGRADALFDRGDRHRHLYRRHPL